MTTESKAPEFLILPLPIDIPCRFDCGPKFSFFFRQIRDHKKLWASKCPKCGRLSCPPTEFCGQCLGVEMTDWVEQNDEGVLVTFDVVFYQFVQPNTGLMQPVPWAFCTIRLDTGALFSHYLVPADQMQHRIGDRYRVVFKEEGRIGWFHDILHIKKI